jgi:proline iminopeptidase
MKKHTIFTFLLLILPISIAFRVNDSNPVLKSGQGFVEVEGGKIWYGIMGSGDETPLLCMHGGPGV